MKERGKKWIKLSSERIEFTNEWTNWKERMEMEKGTLWNKQRIETRTKTEIRKRNS